MGVWHDAKKEVPEDGARVLCVKQLKSGRKDICFGTHWKEGAGVIPGWFTTGSNNNVIYWTELPEIPEEVES
jgi:hypothetical protein